MKVHDTLSTAQWAQLQALFDRALQAGPEERRALLDETGTGEPLLAQSLAAMLAAHEQWRDRTEDARGDWQRQAHASALLANGESIGPYRILGVLGEGGMGVVYRAERADGEVALTAAIKVLRPGALDAVARERFQRERDLLAGLNHPHIARLFDAGVGAGLQPFFVMEYVRGTTIVHWCDERRLDVRGRLKLFLDVCDAVRYAHNQLVLHRDIKPSNVLVDDAGVAKLIDFGIAKPIALDESAAARTATEYRFFSPSNVAPEQLRGERVGVACDVYQLGTLLYELLCGRPIFELEGRTPRAIEEAITRQMPLAPSLRARDGTPGAAQARACADAQALARQLAGDLDEIALMALRKEPSRRYASVEQLMEDVRRHLDVLPVRARGSHRGYRAALFVKRHWRPLVLAGAAVAAVAAFVTALDVQSRQLQQQRDRAVAEQHRAEEATGFLVGVFKAADPKQSMSRNTPIGEVLQNGSRKIDSELKGQPRLMADLSGALASIYLDIDAFADAQKYARRAAELRERLEPGSIALAEALGQLTAIDAAVGDCKATLADGGRALGLYRAAGAGVARSVDVQDAIIRCEAHEKGYEYGRDRSSALLAALQHDPSATALQLAHQEVELADYLNELEDLESATRMRRSAVDRLQRSPWRDSAEAMSAQEALANSLSLGGKFDEARAIFDRLVPQYRKLYGDNALSYAQVLVERGANDEDAGRGRAAEADFLEVRRIRTAAHKGLHSDQARIAFDLGMLYEYEFKDLPRAGPYYDEALRIANATLGPHDLNTLKMRSNRAIYLERAFRDREADPELDTLRSEVSTRLKEGIGIRLALAAIRMKAGRKAEADGLLAECEAAIKARPDLAELQQDVVTVRKGGRL